MSFTALTKRLDELRAAASPGPSRAIDLQIVEASAEIPILVLPQTTMPFSEAEANAELHAPAHEYAACVTALTELESGLADDCCAVFEEFDGMTKTLTREGEELLAKTRTALAALAVALGVSDE